MEENAEFVTLVDHDQYEILSVYPFTIRKNNHRVCSESMNHDGYIQVHLNGKTFLKHRLVALQFIENPNNFTDVDHINHNRTDNRIENQFNKSSNCGVQYEFVDDIPDEAIKVLFYETKTQHHEFEEDRYYYYHDNDINEDIFYGKMTDTLYRIMHINITKRNIQFVSMNDTNNKQVSVCINRFKQQHSLD